MMQHTQYIVPAGPGAAVQSLVAVVAACRAIYQHAYLAEDDAYPLVLATVRAYKRGDLEVIRDNLSVVCALLHTLEGAYDRWRNVRDLLYAIESL